MISLRLKALLFQNLFMFTAVGVQCCVTTLNCLPVLHNNADYIFWSFVINEPMLVCFEYTILLKPALGGVRHVAHLSISIKPSLVYSLYDFLASKGSPF